VRIRVTSIVDLEKSPHNRLHQFIKYLSKNHDITVISINDWWRKEQIDVEDEYLKDTLNNIEIKYLTNKKRSLILQEVLSPFMIRELDDFDIHLNCDALISGYSIAKRLRSKGIPTIFDIADDNVEMIKNSPQMPKFLRGFGGAVGGYMIKKNINIAKKVLITTTTLKETYNIPDGKAVSIPNGVDTNLFKKLPSNKEEFGLSDSFVIGYVGGLREWVNLKPAFSAIKKLSSEMNIKMIVAGKEGEFEENKGLAKECGVEDRVIFTGNAPYAKVPEYIAAMDACIIPFKRNKVSENALPLKLFEYMACGKPVISAKIPGVVDAVQDRVLYAFTAEEYRDKIVKLYKDEELRIKLGIEGRNYVKENYEWSKFASKLEIVLEEVGNR
jgi:glycosyltransferase involved in cell wall biosynthesis